MSNDHCPMVAPWNRLVTWQRDVSTAAKVVKSFQSEFERPKIRFGFLNSKRMETPEIMALADLPSLEVLRSKLLGLINTPARQLAQVLQAPGAGLARVI